MFPDNCERCGLETDKLEDYIKNEVSHWFLCKPCKYLELLKDAKKLLELVRRSVYYREGVRQYRPKLDMLLIDDLYDKLVNGVNNEG